MGKHRENAKKTHKCPPVGLAPAVSGCPAGGWPGAKEKGGPPPSLELLLSQLLIQRPEQVGVKKITNGTFRESHTCLHVMCGNAARD